MTLDKTQLRRPYRVAITVQGNGTAIGDMKNIKRLIKDSDPTAPLEEIRTIRIYKYAPNSTTNRAALDLATPRVGAALVASDYTTHGQEVAAGEDYDFPAEQDLADTYPRSTTTSTVSALVLIGY